MALFGSSSSSSKTSYASRQTQQGRLNLAAANKSDVDIRGLTFEDMDAEVAKAAIAGSVEASKQSSQTAENLGDKALDTARDLGTDAFGVLAEGLEDTSQTQRQALSVSERATANALDFANQATRSDASQALENVAKWGGLAALGVGLAFAFSGKG